MCISVEVVTLSPGPEDELPAPATPVAPVLPPGVPATLFKVVPTAAGLAGLFSPIALPRIRSMVA
jgi:hypothetical protein